MNTPRAKPPRPCLDCGTLDPAGNTRCLNCRRAKDRARVRPHYEGDYRRRAKQVRQAPGPCWLCGRYDLEPGDIWTADHINAGDPASPLAKAHRSCNSARGNRPPVDTSGVGRKLSGIE